MATLTHGMNCGVHSVDEDHCSGDCTCGLEYRVEIERLKELINRDKTGLANALNAVRQVLRSYFWIPLGEWGSYEWDERTEKTFREEIGRCFDEMEKIAIDALKKSGDRSNEAFHKPTPTNPDWRIGLSCKPRLRTHPDYYEPPGKIVGVYPSGHGGITDPDGILRIERGNQTFLAPAGEWITS